MLSHPISRSVLAVACAAALSAACAGDQKSAESPEGTLESPTETSTPQPGDAAMPQPNGQPTETPPDAPPPQSLNEGSSGNALAAPGVAAATPRPTLSDGQIAMISDLVNTAEVEQAKLAQTKAKSTAVKKFAAMMVKHHNEAKAEQNKLVKKLGITPAQSLDATSLKTDADKTMASLRDASGTTFDAVYIDSQVVEHQKVLDTIDQQLLPSAQSPEVKDALQKAREKVASHLDEAKRIQGELAKQTK